MGLVRTPSRAMRIVAGELRGRRIMAPAGRATRPTAERTREALFSILGDISGARVLDLFAGSGALGLEALSRGAEHATFVDDAQDAVGVIIANIAALELHERATVVRADARLAPRWDGPFDLVFVDPPYAEAGELGPLLAHELPSQLSPGGRVVTESDHRAPLELALALRLERRYGDTLIRIHQADET